MLHKQSFLVQCNDRNQESFMFTAMLKIAVHFPLWSFYSFQIFVSQSSQYFTLQNAILHFHLTAVRLFFRQQSSYLSLKKDFGKQNLSSSVLSNRSLSTAKYGRIHPQNLFLSGFHLFICLFSWISKSKDDNQ